MWLVLSLACAEPGPAPPTAASLVPVHHTPPAIGQVEWVEEMILGDGGSGEIVLGVPSFVRTDSSGNIYVADRRALKIHVFDPTGGFVRSVGRRGRSPGELLDISCIEVDSDGRLWVGDGMNRRINRFAADGELLSSYPIDGTAMLWPQRLRQLSAQRYLFLYKMPQRSRDGRQRADAPYLFHLFDGEGNKLARFGRFEDVDASTDPATRRVADHFLQGIAGHFLVEEGGVLYAPALYSGRLARYAVRDGAWQRIDSLSGYVARQQPIEALAGGDAREPGFRVNTQRGPLAALLYNESRGLFRLNDGSLVHFTLITEGDERVFGVEVFDAGGELQAYAPLERAQRPAGGSANLPLFVDWKDAQDRFYLRDGRDLATVRVARLRFISADAGGEPRVASLASEAGR